MTKFLSATLAATLLLAEGGCKPSPLSAPASQATPPDAGSAPRQPTTADVQAFIQGMLPAAFKIAELKTDAPTRVPNAAAGSNVWLLSSKLTLTPVEDLFSLPSPQDAKVIDDLAGELNSLVDWRNRYANSPYAQACGTFNVKVPDAPLPQLIVVTSPKDHPLPPMYAKWTAEWQVDHWQIEPAQENSVAVLLNAGKPRSEFTGPTMVKGSPEAEKAIGGLRDAISQARKDIEVVRSRYAEQIARGIKPGTTYQGRVSFRQSVVPCKVRFVDPPPGADAHFASLEVTLSNEKPPCTFTYNAKVKTELPIPLPNTPSTQQNAIPLLDFDASGQPLTFNLRVSLARSTGKTDERTLPGQILSGNRHDTGSQMLLLLGSHLEGIISYYNTPGITLSVDQVNPAQ